MSDLLRSLEDTVRAETGVFGLMDLDTANCPEPWPAGSSPEDQVVWAQTNRVDFRSAAPDSRVRVLLQAWSGEPLPPTDTWEDSTETEVPLTSGQIRLWELTGGPSPHVFAVGPGRRVYGLRVYSRGHQEALVRYLEGPGDDSSTEQFVLQFWPKRSYRQ